LDGSENAIIDDTSSSGSVTPVLERKPRFGGDIGMLNPQSALHGLVCPCDGFKGWKSISIHGKTASKSFGDLRSLALRWDWESNTTKKEEKLHLAQTGKNADGKYAAGQSPFEKLLTELLGKSLSYFYFCFKIYPDTTILCSLQDGSVSTAILVT
jgi:hypothetical protein